MSAIYGWQQWVLVALAGLAAGFVNAIAGGGSLLSFPALIAAGLSPLVANVSNTVALCSGYLGATVAQRRELQGQGRRLVRLLPASALGGLCGGLLLLVSDARLFELLVPWLILTGAMLLALQQPLAAWLRRSSCGKHAQQGGPAGLRQQDAGGLGADPNAARLDDPHSPAASEAAGREDKRVPRAALPVFLAAVYGGYFGAGLSVIVLAALAISLDETLVRLNGLKQVIALVTNLLAALLFVVAAPLHWPSVVLLAIASLAGGALGGRLASRIPPERLRALVVGISLVVATVYFLR